MKVRELIELVEDAVPDGRDPEKTIVKFEQPVECAGCEYEMTVEIGRDFDRYHEDTLHDIEVPVYFDIEDWTATHNVADVVDSDRAVLVIDKTWDRHTKFMSLAEFMEKLRTIPEDKDVVWADANSADTGSAISYSAGFDFVGNPKTGMRHQIAGREGDAVRFDSVVSVCTDDIAENPNEVTIEEYVGDNEDALYEQARERASCYDGGYDDWLGGDGEDD